MWSAKFSLCRIYRYALFRNWICGQGYAMFIGLNPSTADETKDDPTVRRCIGFAKSWGLEGLFMTNLFAFRATDPADMRVAADPIGPDNDYWLRYCANSSKVIVAAWGEYGTHFRRDIAVRLMLSNLHVLRFNKSGQPAHPLYLPKHLRPVPFSMRAH